MKISLSEIWNFIDLIDNKENGWTYTLSAANVSIPNIKHTVLQQLKGDEHYDTELLPSIFTFREILWQPDVFTDAQMSLPGLRILKAFCDESAVSFADPASEINDIYRQLILGLAKNCEIAESIIDKSKRAESVTKALGELRRSSFPIIKFFIYHPQNRVDYYRDAVNRLNYAVKIMLTQFNGKYTDLEDPYWKVAYEKVGSKEKSRPEKKPQELMEPEMKETKKHHDDSAE